MKCSEFETRLHEMLDERRLPECDARLQSHASQCEACDSLLQTQRRLFSVHTRRVAGTDGRHEVVLRSGRPRRFAISTHRSPWLAATALSLIVIALGVLPWLNAISQPEPIGMVLRDAGQNVADESAERLQAEAMRTAGIDSQAVEAREHQGQGRALRENAVIDSIAVWRDISRTLLDGVNRDGVSTNGAGTTSGLIADHTVTEDGRVAEGTSAGVSSGTLETATLESILEITSSWRPIADSLGETFASLRRLIPIPETGRAPATQPGTSAIFGGAPIG